MALIGQLQEICFILDLEPIQKRQLIQSQVARIKLSTPEFQFLFDIRNNESYLTLKGTVMRTEKLDRRDDFTSNIKC